MEEKDTMQMQEDYYEQPKWFDHEVITCPSCKTKYKRFVFDDEQIVCPRCINKKWLEPESNDE